MLNTTYCIYMTVSVLTTRHRGRSVQLKIDRKTSRPTQCLFHGCSV